MRTTRFQRYVCCGLVALLGVAAGGCGGGPRNPIVPVHGKIAFANGKPLPAGTRLVFNPGQGGVRTAVGVTGPDGTFEVTHVSGSGGAEVGKYTVVLRAPEGDAGGFYKLVPAPYYDEGVFPVEVKEGMSPLDLKVGAETGNKTGGRGRGRG